MWNDLSALTLIICICTALLAGFVDAVAGGGGLIQLPVMLAVFPHNSLAAVSGTNKSISIVGTSVAARTYAKQIPLERRHVLPMALCAFIGSALGAHLITKVDRSAFEPILLIVLISVGMFTLFRPEFGRTPSHEVRGPLSASVFGAGIGFYDGIMGPGTGMFLVFGLVAFIGFDFLKGSASAKFVNVATNLAALMIFIPTHNVMWLVTAFMAPANMLGGYLGAHTALKRGSLFVRLVFLGVQALLIVRLIVSVTSR